MSTSASPITISYGGPPVKVDARRITPQMRVPNLGQDHPLQADERPGDVAARLFELALDAGALIVPAGLSAVCYGDNDIDGGGFVLAVFAQSDPSTGATCGWRDVSNIAPVKGDARQDNDRGIVNEALRFMAQEINTALGLKDSRVSRR